MQPWEKRSTIMNSNRPWEDRGKRSSASNLTSSGSFTTALHRDGKVAGFALDDPLLAPSQFNAVIRILSIQANILGLLVLLHGVSLSGEQALGDIFKGPGVPEIRIQIDIENITNLWTRPRVYVPAIVTMGTNHWAEVGVHLKGRYGSVIALNQKPSLTLKFDKFPKSQTKQGFANIHLNNSLQDPRNSL
jgi:hypothetical protein